MAGAELHFLYVIATETLPDGLGSSANDLLRGGRVFIDETTRMMAERFEGRVLGHLAVGRPERQILQLAADLEADVIVVGSHSKKALERLMLGSVSEFVAKKAQCSVIVARPKNYSDPHSVPEIEPPCRQCLEVQRATDGERLWCEAHANRHAHAHLHYELPPAFAVGSMLLRPDG
jgi:nucleotide-binding universal stress UspA family protein